MQEMTTTAISLASNGGGRFPSALSITVLLSVEWNESEEVGSAVVTSVAFLSVAILQGEGRRTTNQTLSGSRLV